MEEWKNGCLSTEISDFNVGLDQSAIGKGFRFSGI
jgi:hypothetical protein